MKAGCHLKACCLTLACRGLPPESRTHRSVSCYGKTALRGENQTRTLWVLTLRQKV